MAKKMYRSICHTKCYWLNNLWKPGQVYEGEIEPGKHFNADGKLDKPLPPANPGDDPRSNAELKMVLKKQHNFTVPTKWLRKQIWGKLKDLELAVSKDALTNEDESEFIARCGFKSKSKAGLVAHERTCSKCNPIEDEAA